MLLTTPILSTKLFIPPVSYRLTSRSRVVELLAQGNKYKLCLICAPAGFGKTTLVTDWHQAHPQEALAWISLDENDNEPGRFLRYLTASFRDFIPDDSETLLNQLDQSQPVEIENILTALINSLSEYATRLELNHLFLVLDDYHVIVNDVIHKAITLMLEYMPPQLHLIITSRFDPPLPLHRWRARNQLLEIRAADLRFKAEETATFMAQDSSLEHELTPEDILLLTNRTEGWAVGLQLALLWLKSRQNSASALQDFSGNNHFVLEYLAEEVLNRLSETIRTFLLQTSLLDRFNINLTNAVTGLDWNEEDLARLEQANLFLIPLDQNGLWYRYHQLFAEFLQHRLKRESASQLPELQRRASRWFEQNGLINEAIEYGLAGVDYERACALVEEVAWAMILRGELLVFDQWLAKIPKDVLYARPYLCLLSGYAINLKGHLTGLEKLLEVAERGIKLLGASDKLRDYYHFRMQLARQQNNLAATLEYTELTLTTLAADQPGYRVVVETAPAGVYLNQGEVFQAQPYVELLYSSLHQKESFLGQLFPGFILGDLYILQGQLRLAAEIHQEIINIASTHSTYTILSYLRLGNICLEWNEIEQAQVYLNKIEELTNQLGEFYIPPGYYTYSGLWWPLGDKLPTLDWPNASNQQIEKYWKDSYQAQIKAFKDRIEYKGEKRLVELEKWCETRFPGGYQALVRPLEYQIEPQYLTLARVLIHQHKIKEGLALLEELQQLAQRQGRSHNQIKILILIALVHHSNQESDDRLKLALLTLREALNLAEPGGYIRVFQEEGSVVRELLYLLLPMLEGEGRKLTHYTVKLLDTFDAKKESRDATIVDPNYSIMPIAEFSKTLSNRSNLSLSEPLSGREIEVLGLVASGASNREIGEKMVITLPTVKKHLSNIFSKLGVTSRTQLLVRAKELSLI